MKGKSGGNLLYAPGRAYVWATPLVGIAKAEYGKGDADVCEVVLNSVVI